MRWSQFRGRGYFSTEIGESLKAWDARVVTIHLMRSIWQALVNTISALKSTGLLGYQR